MRRIVGNFKTVTPPIFSLSSSLLIALNLKNEATYRHVNNATCNKKYRVFQLCEKKSSDRPGRNYLTS